MTYDGRFWHLLYLAWHAIFKQRCLAYQPYLVGRIIVESLFELFCINRRIAFWSETNLEGAAITVMTNYPSWHHALYHFPVFEECGGHLKNGVHQSLGSFRGRACQ